MDYYIITYQRTMDGPWYSTFRDSDKSARSFAANLQEDCYEVRVFKSKLMARWGPVD